VIQPYFFSLNGFTDEGRAGEEERKPLAHRSLLIDGPGIVEQLTRGRIVISFETAAELAGRVVAASEVAHLPMIGGDLIVWEHGAVWGVHYGASRPTHTVYIHGDGSFLAEALQPALALLDAKLILIPGTSGSTSESERNEAVVVYTEYLRREFGSATTEGISADAQMGSRAAVLEHIFVPQTLRQPVGDHADAWDQEQPRNVGAVLQTDQRIAVLAVPGGGKTTLIKRLATAYAFPDRRAAVDDDLPDRDRFPVVIRCRELGQDAGRPFRETLRSLPLNAELFDRTDAFDDVLSDALQTGSALVLVDGLDEIANETLRKRFSERFVAFLATYPNVAAVITARPAGFRIVAGSVAAVCMPWHLSELDDEGIRDMCRAWIQAIDGRSTTSRREADRLAEQILANDRLTRLARIPLLLTTLILVKRGVGELPRKRTALYQRALDVLLATWNVEGHEPIDTEEAIPQLAWVAYEMSVAGNSQIGHTELQRHLRAARRAMPEIFGKETMSLGAFVKRIEDRSSLLVLVGEAERDGLVERVYEFKHLSFQEYLAAVAVAQEFCSAVIAGEPPASVLRPAFGQSFWREIIPLAAVQLGRQAGDLVEALLDALCSPDALPDEGARLVPDVLAQCLADEVQIHPDLVTRVCRGLIFNDHWSRPVQLPPLLQSRFADTYRALIDEGLKEDDVVSVLTCADAIADIVDTEGLDPPGADEAWRRSCSSHATLALYRRVVHDQYADYTMADALAADGLVEWLGSADIHRRLVAARGLAVLGAKRPLIAAHANAALLPLVNLWRGDPVAAVREAAAHALTVIPLNGLDAIAVLDSDERLDTRTLELQLTYISDSVSVSARRGAALNLLVRRKDTRFSPQEFRAMVHEWTTDDRYKSAWLTKLRTMLGESDGRVLGIPPHYPPG
jgi:hypothetical protein